MLSKKYNLTKTLHEPVMTKEILNYLPLNKFHKLKVVDCTLGFGGHSYKILQYNSNIKIIGIDRDIDAINYTKQYLNNFLENKRINIINDNFSNIYQILHNNNWNNIDVILLDLGLSSYQIDNFHRGFSYKFENAPLDMRMDIEKNNLTASDILNYYPKNKLFSVFTKIKEIKNINKLVNSIILKRNDAKWNRVGEFSELCEKYYFCNRHFNNKRKLSSSLCFQALRIAINDEINELIKILNSSINLLSQNGRIIVLSYNSLEDGIVKNFFKMKSGIKLDIKNNILIDILQYDTIKHQIPILKILTKKPLTPSLQEIKKNPRSSSAKMRVAQRL